MPSNLYEEAVIDIKKIRETATRAAEQDVLKRYMGEVRLAADRFLNEGLDGGDVDPLAGLGDEEGLGGGMGDETSDGSAEAGIVDKVVPTAPSPEADAIAEQDPLAPVADKEDVMVEINLDSIGEDSLGDEVGEEELSAEDIMASVGTPATSVPPVDGSAQAAPTASMAQPGQPNAAPPQAVPAASDVVTQPEEEEEPVLEEGDLMALYEELVLDDQPLRSGNAGVPVEEVAKNAEVLKAQNAIAEDEPDEEKEEKMREEIINLREQNSRLKQSIVSLRTNLQETESLAGRLLYQNQVLSNPSLNERQKSKFVEAIGKANNASEAKQLHESLLAGAEIVSAPSMRQSLQEIAQDRSRATVRADSSLSNGGVDPKVKAYWQKMAGIVRER